MRRNIIATIIPTMQKQPNFLLSLSRLFSDATANGMPNTVTIIANTTKSHVGVEESPKSAWLPWAFTWAFTVNRLNDVIRLIARNSIL